MVITVFITNIIIVVFVTMACVFGFLNSAKASWAKNQSSQIFYVDGKNAEREELLLSAESNGGGKRADGWRHKKSVQWRRMLMEEGSSDDG